MVTNNSTGAYIIPTAANEVTKPSQPAFLATAAAALNITGTGTNYQYGTVAMTQIFDQNSDFNTNGTFTSPVTGKYIFRAVGYLTDCTNNFACIMRINTSNRNYQNNISTSPSPLDSSGLLTILADMDAADTAVCIVAGNGEAADTEDLLATSGGHNVSYFSGYLTV